MTQTEFEKLSGLLYEAKMELAFQRSQEKDPTVKQDLFEAWKRVVEAQGKLNSARNTQILSEQ